MKTLFAKPKFYFIAIVPLLLATAVLKVDCPVCHGQGSVNGSNNMGTVHVVAVEGRIIDSMQDACTGYIVTKARPYITAYNLGTDDANGWLTVDLFNMDTGESLAKQYLPVTVGANTTVILNSLVVFAFYSADIPPKHLDIKIETLTGTVPCTVCDGSGKVSLNTSFLANTFENQLVAEIQTEIEFGPDLRYGEPGSQEWLDWHELA